MTWIQFLLDQGAAETIENKNGETPESLACDLNEPELIRLFTRSFDKIDKMFVTEIHCTNIETIHDYHNLKILKLTDCRKLQDFVELTRNRAFYESFIGPTDPFVFILHVKSLIQEFNTFFCELERKVEKAMILQIYDNTDNLLYFKEANQSFLKLSIEKISKENLMSCELINFEFICKLLIARPKKFGKCSLVLLEMEISN